MYPKLLLVVGLMLLNPNIFSQPEYSKNASFLSIYSAAEKELGIHQELLNGECFEVTSQYRAGHHPYFLTDSFKIGSLVYREKLYNNLQLKYDNYRQELLVSYFIDYAPVVYYVQKEHLTEFSIEDKKFVNKAFDGSQNKKFYQIIGADYPIAILYLWKKHVNSGESGINEYSPDAKTNYILIKDKLYSFKGKHSFLKNFSGTNKETIKNYLKEHRISLRNANDEKMEILLKFINS